MYARLMLTAVVDLDLQQAVLDVSWHALVVNNMISISFVCVLLLSLSSLSLVVVVVVISLLARPYTSF